MRARPTAVGIAFAFAVASACGAARADEVGLVVHAPGPAPVSSDAVAAAMGAAASHGGWTAEARPLSRAAAAVTAGAVPRERLDEFAAIEAIRATGWRAYLEARPTLAASRLGDARAAAAALLDLDGGLELYADLSLRLGAVKLAMGRDEEAALDFRLAAVLDPDREVTDAEFKPEVVARAAAARSEQRVGVARRIEVDPPGASVEVDGREVGRAPVSVELEVGLHVVVARAAGRAARAGTVAVAGEDPSQVIALVLDEDPLARAASSGAREMRIGRDEEEAARAGEALLVYGDLDALLVVASVWRRGSPALLGQLCRGRPLRCGRVVEIGYPRAGDVDRAAVRLWREALAAPARFPLTLLADARLTDRERPRGGGPDDGGGGRRRSWWRSGWLWLGLGGAALTLTAGLLLAGDDEVDPVVVVRPCDFGGC